MARLHTGNHEIVSLRNGYHGMSPYTMGLTAHGPWTYNVPGASGFGIHHAMNPDPFRGLFGGANCRDSPVQVEGRGCECAAGGGCEAAGKYMEQFNEACKNNPGLDLLFVI